MDFDLDVDFSIFDGLLKRRPEISAEGLKKDLQNYYLPYAQKLVTLRQQSSASWGLIVGISAIQGAGKTTQGEILKILLDFFGHSSQSLSIDDHYVTHRELVRIRQQDPRFIRRGVTHDIGLAMADLQKLRSMDGSKPMIVSGYDKGAHQGDGDRFRWINPVEGLEMKAKVAVGQLVINRRQQRTKALQPQSASFWQAPLELPANMGSDVPISDQFLPGDLCQFLSLQGFRDITITGRPRGEAQFSGDGTITVSLADLPNGWKVVAKKPDFIFYDGWMLGARQVTNESVFDSGLPALETAEARQFARDVNKKLDGYEPLWQLVDFMNVLYVPDYQISLAWRDQAEDRLRVKGEGMSHEQIREFVYYFWRSVHPGIHIRNLALDTTHTNQVVIIDDDHSVGDVLTPGQVKERYGYV